ncbi:MAG: hypothetical protein V4689_23130 [Verrucomicrobiota bacterium]
MRSKTQSPAADICKFLAFSHDGRQVPAVRGSPVLRFILLAIALAATAVGLRRVTSSRAETSPVVMPEKPVTAAIAVPFRLVLSAPATAIEIDSGKMVSPSPDGIPVSGTLEMDPSNPHVSLVVRWKNPAAVGEHRFAKLTLEAPGQPTFTHVFDADGDIDEFLELPFPAAK